MTGSGGWGQAPPQVQLLGNADGTRAARCYCKVAISHGSCVGVHLSHDIGELYESYSFNQNLPWEPLFLPWESLGRSLGYMSFPSLVYQTARWGLQSLTPIPSRSHVA